jgi:hypothetical protein
MVQNYRRSLKNIAQKGIIFYVTDFRHLTKTFLFLLLLFVFTYIEV